GIQYVAYSSHHGRAARLERADRRAGAEAARRGGPLARGPGDQERGEPLDDLADRARGGQPHRGGAGEAGTPPAGRGDARRPPRLSASGCPRPPPPRPPPRPLPVRWRGGTTSPSGRTR